MKLTKTTKNATLVISILTASLVNEYLVRLVDSYYKEGTLLSVLIGMLVTVLIFVPMFGFVRGIMDKASKSYLKASKKIAKKNSTGLFIGFLIAFAILFILFAKTRHNIDVLARLTALLK